jgi:cell division protein FtsX
MTTFVLQTQPLEELAKDPLLTVASVLLMVVAIGWIVVSRLVSRNLRKTAARSERKKGAVRPAKDIWTEPPD